MYYSKIRKHLLQQGLQLQKEGQLSKNASHTRTSAGAGTPASAQQGRQ